MASFVSEPEHNDATRRLYAEDLADDGYVANLTRVWAHQPTVHEHLVAGIAAAVEGGGLTFRQRGILVSACASTLGDSYCALAWGSRLASEVGAAAAAGVLTGDDSALDPDEVALARWARQLVRDPNATGAADVQVLRDAGFTDSQIVAITAFVAFRLAFSTVNDALGAKPDPELAESAPGEITAAVDFGRRVG